jgi:hypothetical protein
LKRRIVLPVQGMGSTHKRLLWSKIMSLDLLFEMIWNGSQPMCMEYVYRVESYTIPYAMITMLRWCSSPTQKEATYCTRVYVQSNHWTWSILRSSTYDLIDQHRFLWAYLVIFKVSSCAEGVPYSM